MWGVSAQSTKNWGDEQQPSQARNVCGLSGSFGRRRLYLVFHSVFVCLTKNNSLLDFPNQWWFFGSRFRSRSMHVDCRDITLDQVVVEYHHWCGSLAPCAWCGGWQKAETGLIHSSQLYDAPLLLIFHGLSLMGWKLKFVVGKFDRRANGDYIDYFHYFYSWMGRAESRRGARLWFTNKSTY